MSGTDYAWPTRDEWAEQTHTAYSDDMPETSPRAIEEAMHVETH